MSVVFLIGRIVFALFWLKSGYGHLVTRRKDMIGYSTYKKVPAPAVAVVGSGILLLIGGLSMLLGVWPYIGLTAIALFLIGVTFKMHDFWKETDPTARMNSNINFWKNVTLFGAVLMMFAISVPWPLSL
jgi:putative oxidoreductase